MKLLSFCNKSSLRLLCTIYFFASLLYYYGGRAHDSKNILLGNFIDSQGGVEDRSFVVSLVLYPFIALGPTYGFLFYLIISTFLLYRFSSIGVKSAPPRLRHILLFSFLPVFAFPVLLPGKESIVFFIVYYIYYSGKFSLDTFKPIPPILRRCGDVLLRIILFVIAFLIRPNIILLTPMIICSLFVRLDPVKANQSPACPRSRTRKSAFLVAFLCGSFLLLFLCLSLDYLSDVLMGVYRLSSFDVSGNSSHASFVNMSLVSQSNVAMYALGASAIGFPLAQGLQVNLYACLIGFIAVFPSYLVYLSAAKMVARWIASQKIQLIALFYVFALVCAVLGSLFASVAFLANAGTGARYFLVYTQVILLSYVSYCSNSIDSGSVFSDSGKFFAVSSVPASPGVVEIPRGPQTRHSRRAH